MKRSTSLLPKGKGTRTILLIAAVVLVASILMVALIAPATAHKGARPMLTGTVTGEGSEPVGGVRVQVLSGTTVVARGETNDKGQYRIGVPVGTYDVAFSARTYETLIDAAVVVTDPSTTLDAALVRLPVLTGTVTDGSAPVRGVKVKALSGATVVGRGETNRDGVYKVYVPAGTYDVSFERRTFEPLAYPGVVVSGPSTTLDATLVHLPILTGTVTGAGGLPVMDAHVKVLSGATVIAKAETGVDGQYSVYLPAGTYDVQVCAKTYEPWSSAGAVVAGPSTTLDAALTLLPVLTGTVTDAGALPLDDVHVKVMSGATVVARGETDASGQYTVYVPAGTYDVAFCLWGYDPVTSLGAVLTGPSTLLDAVLTPTL
jgi:hypothetical protein